MKILIAVDGSKPSLDAVQTPIDHADWYREMQQVPKLPGMGAAVGKGQLEKYRSGKALRGSTATKVLHISDIPVLLVK